MGTSHAWYTSEKSEGAAVSRPVCEPVAGVAKLKLFSLSAGFLAGNLAALSKKPPNFLRAISSYF